ncbi:hypothetical protein BJV82DRAFT_639423, partial [Fennellomyces sp. T-0311]
MSTDPCSPQTNKVAPGSCCMCSVPRPTGRQQLAQFGRRFLNGEAYLQFSRASVKI